MLDWKKFSADILANLGDQGKLTQILSDFETEVTTNNTKMTDLEKQAKTHTEQIESLQKTNMNLFLKVGNPAPDEAVRSTEPTLSYEALFDENGGLK